MRSYEETKNIKGGILKVGLILYPSEELKNQFFFSDLTNLEKKMATFGEMVGDKKNSIS